MYGPLISGILIAVVVGVILLLTMHWWSRIIGAAWRRIALNVRLAGEALGDAVKRKKGQGQGAVRNAGQQSERR